MVACQNQFKMLSKIYKRHFKRHLRKAMLLGALWKLLTSQHRCSLHITGIHQWSSTTCMATSPSTRGYNKGQGNQYALNIHSFILLPLSLWWSLSLQAENVSPVYPQPQIPAPLGDFQMFPSQLWEQVSPAGPGSVTGFSSSGTSLKRTPLLWADQGTYL